MHDFANILFAGPCNRACPWCIGKLLPAAVNASNLETWPLPGLEGFLAAVNGEGIEQVVLTGTVSDPQLYRHEGRLLGLLRARLHPGARISLHTNGVRALARRAVFNRYDRAAISFPSFRPATYAKLMGSRAVPDLAAILAAARIPVKVSCVLNEHNAAEIDEFLGECRRLGVRRVVLRKLFGDRGPWPPMRGLERVGEFKGNPVFDLHGMEVTRWDFDDSACRSINLFADGTLGTSYLLTRTPELQPA